MTSVAHGRGTQGVPETELSVGDDAPRTRVDVNRNGTPDVLQQPQFGLEPQGFASLVPHGAPVNMGMTTVAGVDMNCDGIPDVLQQPQSGLGTAHKGFAAPQGDLTMEERTDLTVLFIAVCDELLDRDEDPALVDLVYQLMDWLLDADTSEIADDARENHPSPPPPPVRHRPHHAEEELELVVRFPGARKNIPGGLAETELELTVSESLCHTLGHVKHTRELAKKNLVEEYAPDATTESWPY